MLHEHLLHEFDALRQPSRRSRPTSNGRPPLWCGAAPGGDGLRALRRAQAMSTWVGAILWTGRTDLANERTASGSGRTHHDDVRLDATREGPHRGRPRG